jgi:hypothetical protein
VETVSRRHSLEDSSPGAEQTRDRRAGTSSSCTFFGHSTRAIAGSAGIEEQGLRPRLQPRLPGGQGIAVTSRAMHYRREAEQAERMARQMSRHDHKLECLQIARTWRDLAEAEERTSPVPAPPGDLRAKPRP